MKRADFHYDLPKELIAQRPPASRGASRLLVLDGATGTLEDHEFGDLQRHLVAGDVLVLNDTRVLPARIFGHKPSGGRVEMLLDRAVSAREALMQLRSNRPPKVGTVIGLLDDVSAEVLERDGGMFRMRFSCDVSAYLEKHGQTPLPPYIERAPTSADRERYQTVYACRPGAVAAPTAGLHFDTQTLAALELKGVEIATVTLHVGAGTFSPVRAEVIEQHALHAERYTVDRAVAERVNRAKSQGRRVVAVGTTVVRALESAAKNGRIEPIEADTQLFIYPGYDFQLVDALLTNFHLPESSLLMLVAAFAGFDHVMAAYRHAVAERYRFFSYGDAMFVTAKCADSRA